MEALLHLVYLQVVVFIFLTITAGIAVFVYLRWFYVDFAKVEGIPEIPGGGLVSGHLYMLGENHAATAEKWSEEHNWPIYQLRMGNRRAIMLNSFDVAKEWIITNQTGTIDRPWMYTFHGVVSSTSAATIGTSPWDERTKKRRRIVGSLTTGPSIQRLKPLFDMESTAMIEGMYRYSNGGLLEIMPHDFAKRLALNIVTMFCYGTRFSSIEDPLLHQILNDANRIARWALILLFKQNLPVDMQLTALCSFRSTNSNTQDYIPHLRFFSNQKRTAEAIEVRTRRDRWLSTMLDRVRSAIATGKGKPCVAEGLLKDKDERLTKDDVKIILGGLMSGAFETMFSTIIICIGVLSTPEGQAIQQSTYEDIMNTYPTAEEAWKRCLLEEKCQSVIGLVRETLRFYSPLKLLPPRQTYKEFNYNGSKIPKGLMVYINAQAINRDKSKYGPDADRFRPSRWHSPPTSSHPVPSPPPPPPYHFSYGAGSRMCTAVNFSNRVLYIVFLRLVLSFKMVQSSSMPPNVDYMDYNRNFKASNAISKDFKVTFVPREKGGQDMWVRESWKEVRGLDLGGGEN
ncbi:MAG: hypothetical protein M1834_007271 [Cirrosporium novae-zelandiae]|nr:MAG: hypothetical protein M1834_007271 [Cirrosporium novae-zelandiae]